MSVEIRLNGMIITALTARNLDGGEVSTYEYQGFTFPLGGSGPGKSFHGRLTHTRNKGAEVLCSLLLAAAAAGAEPKKKK